jgi:retinol-binding protein 3
MRRMKPRMSRLVTAALSAVFLSAAVHGGRTQQRPGPAPATIDAATRTAVIAGAIDHMRRAYIFADVAEKMDESLRTRVERKEYDAIVEPKEFAETLTKHLQEVSRDKHLRIVFNPEGLPQRSGPPGAEERARMLADERRRNFGFERLERLDGNVGYIELRGFSGTPEARDTAVAAMNLVADTDALIFDLRRNGGGSPFMIGILSSYLFDRVVHLNDFYVRETDSRREFFTTAEVQGRRYGVEKPVYVLTSSRTFSAAEEFTYNLKNLERATIVGETSGGGAHPGGVRRITDYFGIWLPNGRAINPITKTNWEGTGVEPHIKVSSADALRAAHLDALQKVRSTATDSRHRDQLDAAIAALEKPKSQSPDPGR